MSNGRKTQTLCQLDLYTKYGNVWYIGCEDDTLRGEWNESITSLLPEADIGHFVYSETSETMMEPGDHDVTSTPPPRPSHSAPPPALSANALSAKYHSAKNIESADDTKSMATMATNRGAEGTERTERKENVDRNVDRKLLPNLFGGSVFEAECKSVRKCHSVSRLIECMHIWNGNGDEERINELLAQNRHFPADYEHILKWHLDSKNEFQALYKHILKHIRHVDLYSHRDLQLPDESQQHTFYVNAMYVIHCYLFGNLV